MDTYHFYVLSFVLGIVPRVLTKLTKQVTKVSVDHDIDTLFYLDNWLIISPSANKVKHHVGLAWHLAVDMGFLYNLPKSFPCPQPEADVVGHVMGKWTMSIFLFVVNFHRITPSVRQATDFRTFTRLQWGSSLNHDMEVVLVGP